VRLLILALVLAALWIAMSGHFSPIILAMGALGVVLVVWLAARMGLDDRESLPYEIFAPVVPYWVWLGREIVASNIVVGKIVLAKRPPISPSVVELEDGQTSDLGRALLGNSITLTPGTVTLDADGRMLKVHALTEIGANDLRSGAMRDRAAQVDAGGREEDRG